MTDYNHIHPSSSGEPSDADKRFVARIHFYHPNASAAIYPKDTRFPIKYYDEKTPFNDMRELPEFEFVIPLKR